MARIALIIPGLVILIILMIASIVASVFMGMSITGDSTLTVMAGLFMFTAPYALIAALSLMIYHNKQSQIIGYTVNAFAVIMLFHWVYVNLVGMPEEISIGDHFNETIWNTLFHTIGLDVVFIIILVVEAQLIWTPAEKK